MRIDLLAPCLLTAPCLLLVLGASSTASLSHSPEESSAAPVETAAVAELGAVLSRALATIDADEISADLHFLASDEMKGRNTPSPEQRIAARFIASRLQRLGWQPGAQEGYFWEYELPISAVDPERSRLLAERGGETLELALGTDYAFYPRSSKDAEVEAAPAIYAGTLSAGDCEGLDLAGRWVFYRSSAEVDRGDIQRTLRRGEAVGAIVLPGSDLDESAMVARVESWGKQVLEPKLSRGSSGRGSSSSKSPSKSPASLCMTEAGARRLLALAGAGEFRLGEVYDLGLSETRTSIEDSSAQLENVIGLWPGRDPELAKELIIVSAHYDHVGTNDAGEVYNGADDNGSGTVGLLAVAESLASYGPMRRSVMLMWVSGEEKGLLGSAAWTKDPYLPGGLEPVANVNIDMIGRNATDSLLITPTAAHDAYNGLTRMAEAHCAEEGFPTLGNADAYWGRSDHANFSRNLDIPVAFLFSDVHEDYHKLTDTPDKIDYDKIRRVSRLVVRLLHGLQTDELALD